MDFSNVTNGILRYIDTWEQKLIDLPVDTITRKRNKQNRTIKQILGHLIDSAANNHQRMVRLQYNDKLDFPDFNRIMTCGLPYKIIKMLIGILRFSCGSIIIYT